MAYHSESYYQDLKRHKAIKGWSFHHFHYKQLSKKGRGYSIYWIDGIHIPGWLHVPIIHRILGGGSRAGNQRFGKFPNPAQRFSHMVLRFVMPIPIVIKKYGFI